MIDWLYAGLAGTSHMSLATVADAAAAAVPSATAPPGLSDPIHVCAATAAAAAAVSAGAVVVLTYVLSDTTHVRAVTIAAAAAAAVASAAASVLDPPYSHHRPAPPTPLTCVGQDLLCLSVAILVQIITGTRFTPFDRIDTDHHAVVGD